MVVEKIKHKLGEIIKKFRLRLEAWKLANMSRETYRKWIEFLDSYKKLVEQYNIYVNQLYKFGYIKEEDVKKLAEEKARKKIEELQKRISYIG